MQEGKHAHPRTHPSTHNVVTVAMEFLTFIFTILTFFPAETLEKIW